MSMSIARIEIRYEQDVVYVRQRARLISDLLGFDRNDQTRISTAVSEIARNAYQYGLGGDVEFMLDDTLSSQVFTIAVRDHGPGIKDINAILEGRYTSRTGMGMGILGTRRLMDKFRINTSIGKGTEVYISKTLPVNAEAVTQSVLLRIAESLAVTDAESPLEEIRVQNQELMRTLDELKLQRKELEDTNRGVVALYAELDEKVVQLRGLDKLKSQFLANMSHEFRTPLNAITSLSRLLLDRTDGDLTPEQEKQVMFISKAATDFSMQVNDLLDLAKIEAGRTEVSPQKCSVDEIFEGLSGMLKPLMVNTTSDLIFDSPKGIPPLFTDGGKLAQILRNFLTNSIKFTEHGEIRASARLGDDGQTVIFAVSDTGIGIALEDQEIIFNEYMQVETAQHGKPRGTGLGLPISRKLAELLGGKVEVQSHPGLGSTFTATIPIQYGSSQVVDVGVTPLSHVTTNYQPVLVVEDDAATQLVYDKYLMESGFEVIPALSVSAARQMLLCIKPAVIVLDILMSDRIEDGWTILAELKANTTTSDIPVIIVSVLEEKDKGLSLGADEYSVKPVDREWLLGKLRSLTGLQLLAKILIIDDDSAARYILKAHLADTGYTILEAADGMDGLRLAESERPGAIFLDMIMPGMSGLEVLARLKANPATTAIPVIISSSKEHDEAEQRAFRQLGLAVLPKEILSREDAAGAVKAVLQKVANTYTTQDQGKV